MGGHDRVRGIWGIVCAEGHPSLDFGSVVELLAVPEEEEKSHGVQHVQAMHPVPALFQRTHFSVWLSFV